MRHFALARTTLNVIEAIMLGFKLSSADEILLSALKWELKRKGAISDTNCIVISSNFSPLLVAMLRRLQVNRSSQLRTLYSAEKMTK